MAIAGGFFVVESRMGLFRSLEEFGLESVAVKN